MSAKPHKILWSSNSPWSTSGYGQQTALTVPRIQALGHDVAINCFFGLEGAAIQWNGINCYPTDQTRFGNLMLGDYAHHHTGGKRHECLILTLMDVWVMLQGIPNMKDLRFACWTPVDHDPVPPMVVEFLRQVQAQVIAMTRFGERRLTQAGFHPMYVPHAVDTSIFKPDADQGLEQRKQLNIPEDAFVVGMVANNQGVPSRKAFPQVFEAFAEFRKRHSDAMLYVHGDVFGRNQGVDLQALAGVCGIPDEATRATEHLALHIGIPPQTVASLYNMFDVLAMPSMGEGFGIPLIEAQACGVPVITTDWTAMTELCGAGWLVDGDRFYDATQRSFFKLARIGDILDALEMSYEKRGDKHIRAAAAEFALAYDVDLVFDTYWKPVLERLTKPREVAPLQLVAA